MNTTVNEREILQEELNKDQERKQKERQSEEDKEVQYQEAVIVKEKIVEEFLFSEKSNQLLTLTEIEYISKNLRSSSTLFSLYGRNPQEFIQQGLQLLGRTAIECTIDSEAVKLAETAYKIKNKFFPEQQPIVIDLFNGSGNTLYHISKKLKAFKAIGFENNETLYEATKCNFSKIDFQSDLYLGDSMSLLKNISFDSKRPIVFFISPPWLNGFDYKLGLDLHATSPPVSKVLDLLQKLESLQDNPTYFLIQICDKMVEPALSDIKAAFKYSLQEVEPNVSDTGLNVGLLCCTNYDTI